MAWCVVEMYNCVMRARVMPICSELPDKISTSNKSSSVTRLDLAMSVFVIYISNITQPPPVSAQSGQVHTVRPHSDPRSSHIAISRLNNQISVTHI